MKYYFYNLNALLNNNFFFGWGRKKTGKFAIVLSKIFQKDYLLLEDGFIRSVGLGIEGFDSFSIVQDNLGIYYDATTPSKLEEILKTHNFSKEEIAIAKKAIELIKKYKISKYNLAPLSLPKYLQEDKNKKVLIIAQTKGDMSLKYGLATKELAYKMLKDAKKQNPNASLYLKIHPDVLSGKKESNIDIHEAKKYCTIITENINPIILLEQFDKVYTQTSQMGFEALFLGKEVHIYGAPFYVGWHLQNLYWHLEEDKKKQILKRRGRKLSIEEIFYGAYILYTTYYNPYKKQKSDIFDTIEEISMQREKELNKTKGYFFGFSLWKHQFMKPFFHTLEKIIFINPLFSKNYLKKALKAGLDKNSAIYIWGRKEFKEIQKYAKEHNIPIFRVEDGFIRSVSLGSDLTQPYSLVIDSKGIYFDPTQESDLEHILNTHSFSQEELQRAEVIKNLILEKKLSKYNIYESKSLDIPKDKHIVVVPGQVEDDASIKYGANGMTNLELLQKTRKNVPNSFIIYKPHPDVLSGNRVGGVKEEEALKYCDTIVTKISLDSVLEIADEIHTMTSLVGFEALLRGKTVYTYGIPFYAGWGLTIDEKICKRRVKKRSLNELIAATLLLYPKYISPQTKEEIPIENLIKELEEEKEKLQNKSLLKTFSRMRNFTNRKIQLIIRFLRM